MVALLAKQIKASKWLLCLLLGLAMCLGLGLTAIAPSLAAPHAVTTDSLKGVWQGTLTDSSNTVFDIILSIASVDTTSKTWSGTLGEKPFVVFVNGMLNDNDSTITFFASPFTKATFQYSGTVSDTMITGKWFTIQGPTHNGTFTLQKMTLRG